MTTHDFQPGTRVKVAGTEPFPDTGYVVFSDDAGYVVAFKWSDPLIAVEKEGVSFDAKPTYWDGSRPKSFGDIVMDEKGNTCLLLDARFDDYATVTLLGNNDPYRIDTVFPYKDKEEASCAESPNGHDFQPGTKVSVNGIHFGRQDGIVVTVSESTYGIRFSWSDHTLFVLKERVTFRGEPTYWEGSCVTNVGDVVRDSQGNPFIFLGTKGGLPEVTPYGEDAATTVNHIYSGVIVPEAESKEEPKQKLEFGDRFAVIQTSSDMPNLDGANSYAVVTFIKDGALHGAIRLNGWDDVVTVKCKNVDEAIFGSKAAKWDGELATLRFGVVCLYRGERCVIADDSTSSASRDVIRESQVNMVDYSVPVSELRPADYDFPYYFGQKVYSTNNKTLGVFIEPVSEGLVSIAIQDEHGVGKIVNVALNGLSTVSPAFTYVNEHSDEPRNFGDVVRSDDCRYVILNTGGDTALECTGRWYGIDDNGDEVYDGQYN